MEIVGLVSAVVGLVPICIDAFELMEHGFKADHEVQQQYHSILCQQGVRIGPCRRFGLTNKSQKFLAWAEWWELSPPERQGKHEKLESHLRDSRNATLVTRIVLYISQLLADSKRLRKRYGVDIVGVDDAQFPIGTISVEEVLEGRLIPEQSTRMISLKSRHMSLLSKARFAVSDRKTFKNLVLDLNEQVSTLQSICSELAASAIDRSMTNRVLVGHQNDTNEFLLFIQSLRDMAMQAPDGSNQRKRLDLIVNTAELKQKLPDVQRQPYKPLKRADFNYEKDSWEFNGGSATFALHRYADPLTCCYIEWKTYDNNTNTPNIPSEHDIEQLVKLFCLDGFPAALNTLPCLGAFRDEDSQRYGLVYKPPTYIERVPLRDSTSSGPASVLSRSEQRKPSTLLSEIMLSSTQKTRIPDLGTRFSIAKALVQSIYVLHMAGWIHKNIRPSSVLFLPYESVSTPGVPSRRGVKDLGRPFLSGFGFSRAIIQSSGDYEYYVRNIPMANSIHLDSYQHPEKQVHPETMYTQSFDIYSLGCLLLEIALWKPLDTMVQPVPRSSRSTSTQYADPYDFRDRLKEFVWNELPSQVGRIYAKAVYACLGVGGSESAEASAELLCWKVAARLDECCA